MLIVVVRVFIGIQVANWNDSRATYQTETRLLQELKREVEKSIVLSNHHMTSYQQVTNAGKRSLDFIAKEVPCENMRSLGFPKYTPEGNC